MEVFVASPVAANGICWLLNCLLELDVMCYRLSIDNMWRKKTVWDTVGMPSMNGLLFRKRDQFLFKQLYKFRNSINKRVKKINSHAAKMEMYEAEISQTRAAMGLEEGESGAFSQDEKRRVGVVLKPNEYKLQVHLPIFARKKEFAFMPGLAVEWDHVYPQEKKKYDKAILFVRDPRDAVLSIYKRFANYPEFKNMSYAEFCGAIQPHSKLSYLEDWILLHLMWLERKDVLVIRFEDYKADAYGTLRKALDYLGLRFSDAEMKQAVENSTHQKSREAEESYYAGNPMEAVDYRINRASTVNDYVSHADAAVMSEKIFKATSGLLNRMGYSFADASPSPTLEDFLPRLPRNEWFASLPSAILEKAAKL